MASPKIAVVHSWSGKLYVFGGDVSSAAKRCLEQFHIENVDCSGSRESDYPQPNTRKNRAFSVVRGQRQH